MSASQQSRSILWRMGLAVIFLVSFSVAPIAYAGLTDNLLIDPTAMAMGNAVTADPPKLNSIHFNPAGLARMTGNHKMDGVLAVSLQTKESFTSAPDLDIGGFTQDPLNGTQSGLVTQRLYVPGVGMLPWKLPLVIAPSMGFSFNKEGSPFTFATATYLPMAMSLDRTTDENDPSRFGGQVIQMQRLVYLSPAVGYKVSDTLRVGASVPIAHQAIVLETDMRMPNKLLGITGSLQKGFCPEGSSNVLDTFTFGLCGGGKDGMLDPFKRVANMSMEMTTPFDPTINLGVLWEPKDWFAFGATYQSGSNTVYHGTYKFKTDPMLRAFVQGLNSSLMGPIVGGITGLPQYIPPVQSGNLIATIPYPDRWQFGIKLKPIDAVQFNVDVSYTDWAKWDALKFQFDQDIGLLQMARMFGIANSSQLVVPMGLESVVNYGLGMQVKITPKLALRFGYEPRKSSVPLNKLSLFSPLPDTVVKSVGVQLKLANDTEINVAASYMTGSYHIPARTNCNLNCDDFFNIVYNPYAASDVDGSITVRYIGANLTHRF